MKIYTCTISPSDNSDASSIYCFDGYMAMGLQDRAVIHHAIQVEQVIRIRKGERYHPNPLLRNVCLPLGVYYGEDNIVDEFNERNAAGYKY